MRLILLNVVREYKSATQEKQNKITKVGNILTPGRRNNFLLKVFNGRNNNTEVNGSS